MLSLSTYLDRHVRDHTRSHCALAGCASLIAFTIWEFPADRSWLLHLFYVPMTLSASLPARSRARPLTLWTIALASLTIFVGLGSHANDSTDPTDWITLLAWTGAATVIAVVTDQRTASWQKLLDQVEAMHRRDVLTDPLTGVANRRAFDFELGRRLAVRDCTAGALSVASVDIDYFKQFNDRYGHDAGDAVLRQLAGAIGESLREGDLIARVGGEEFAAIVAGADLELAIEAAERMRKEVETHRFCHEDLRLRVTLSVGVASLRAGESAASLLKRADAALYAAKEAGRNCVCWHDGQRCLSLGGTTTAHAESAESAAETADGGARDPVTGLPSRDAFMDELGRRSAECRRYGRPFVVAIVRLAHLRASAACEPQLRKRMMARTAQLLSAVLRETDLVARFDAGSLALLMPSTNLSEAGMPLQRLTEAARAHCDEVFPSASFAVDVGAAEAAPDDDVHDLLDRAAAPLQPVAASAPAGA
jgi:diguanylate cyclase (GGDEF)-like protein